MNDVFDGVAEIFIDVFGEAVVYTPAATGIPKTIRAAWLETALSANIGDVAADVRKTELSVLAAVVADPKEGDQARREKDGKTMKVTTPIQPDGQGIIVCNLAE
jgi:hypothetical protein